MTLNADALLRLLLLFTHLLLCVFALQIVLSCDWKVLTRRVGTRQLHRVHQRLTLLLGGLWLTGLGLVAVDTGFSAEAIAARPKLIAKLACVCTLTLNALVLRAWCFPRVAGGRELGRLEAMAVMAFGAVSTSSWLMAAFFGIAKPLQALTVLQCLALYVGIVAFAVAVAVVLSTKLQVGQPVLKLRNSRRMSAAGP